MIALGAAHHSTMPRLQLWMEDVPGAGARFEADPTKFTRQQGRCFSLQVSRPEKTSEGAQDDNSAFSVYIGTCIGLSLMFQ